MERAISFTCTPDEFISLIKSAIREVDAEREATQPIVASSSLQLEVLSPAQVCDILKISRPTLIRYARDNILRGKKVGGKVFYQKSSIDKFLATRQR